MNHQPDGSLPAARQALTDAIAQLIEPQYHPTDTGHTWLDSLYVQLVEAVPGTKRDHRGAQTSQPPCWVDALDLLNEIKRNTAAWWAMLPKETQTEPIWSHYTGDDTTTRLRAIQDLKWRPQDTSIVTGMAISIGSWTDRITELLADNPRKHLPNPCPSCNTTTIYRRDNTGEYVRQPALQLTKIDGTYTCQCQACRTSWGPEKFLFLGRLLGYELPAGVLE